jgi:hypothetical protein
MDNTKAAHRNPTFHHNDDRAANDDDDDDDDDDTHDRDSADWMRTSTCETRKDGIT